MVWNNTRKDKQDQDFWPAKYPAEEGCNEGL